MSARSLNRVMLIGNLTRDPELRYTPQGTAVATFGLATNRSWTTSDGGDRQEETEFHRIVAWSKLAEICSQLLYKGRKVYVEGRLQTRKWTGSQDGIQRETTEVVIDSMIALGAPKGGSSNGGGSYSNNSSSKSDDFEYDDFSSEGSTPAPVSDSADTSGKTSPAANQTANEDVNADDIPF